MELPRPLTDESPASESAPLPPARREADAIVWVVLDGVRWQEIFHGVDPALAEAAGISPREVLRADALLPNLHRFFAGEGSLIGDAARGDRVLASGPNYVSLPGYTELFSGAPPVACVDNDCAATSTSTFADEVRALPALGKADVAVFSSWERIERAASRDPSRITLSAGRSARLESEDRELARLFHRARLAGSSPGTDDYRADVFTAPIALRYLEKKQPTFLFLGLGDTDEHAHHGDYRAYLKALRDDDAVLGRLVSTLARMGERGRRTTVFVTTDHGRATSFRDHGGFAPESGNVWIGVRGAGVRPGERGRSGFDSEAHLLDVAQQSRRLLGLTGAGERKEPGPLLTAHL